eukprot:CAMPEP_0180800032 /NCGR_PEP_ID=MMETSP1038_2-20121128/58879_1 /TAXON_ID=632150 /ORGANISM="Azadinium spinosum, Strain 3D9" /LENGTH=152 /DNA_ID=CAMNT_0022839717 /DNA_START=1 /DNA_END=455 /DNA_ORIENTATION=-
MEEAEQQVEQEIEEEVGQEVAEEVEQVGGEVEEDVNEDAAENVQAETEAEPKNAGDAGWTIALQAVQEEGVPALESASEMLREDRAFMLAAAACCPSAGGEALLRCASGKLRREFCADRDLVLKIVKESGARALEYVSSELRADLGFMLEVA